MKYTGRFLPFKKRITDLGIDLPSDESVAVPPMGIVIVDTGIQMEFPLFGKFRRWLTKLLFGTECVGIGGLIWPKGGSDYTVLAGVVDPEYRGTIKVKIHNNYNEYFQIARGDYIAQLVPVLSFNIPLGAAYSIDEDTDRGKSGGINN